MNDHRDKRVDLFYINEPYGCLSNGLDPYPTARGYRATKDGCWVRERPKVGRNDPCPCGCGRKAKRCHTPLRIGGNVQPEVGLRVLWRGSAPGVITDVEPRRSGGPLVSVRLDDGTEMHGLTVGEWQANAEAHASATEGSR